ncbi:hypothetical protein TanjilG_12011 [Lupinus angustifolius]|uniref:Transmembrane protein n=1 Tax=Lupinus angustifolius TaxID=3871 RepID=A0A1J7GSI8_LUPAN|nr:hypothetical protein TanjilG_12011 [Lupinus angustifolius]
MAFSLKKIIFIVVHLVVIMFTIFVASPQSGVACRPLLLNNQLSVAHELHLQARSNNPAPPSGGSKDHP